MPAVIRAYLRLPHALPVLIVLGATAAISFVVDSNAAWRTHAGILVAMLGAQVVIGVVNELVDLDLDRGARPDKPLVSGLVSRRGAINLLVVAVAVMVVAGSTLGIWPLLVCLLGCGIGVAYSLWLKRTLVAFLPYVAAIPLLPIWVALSHGQLDGQWLLLFPLGALALTGVQIAQSLPDVLSDRAAGIHSVTTVLGEPRSLLTCWVLIVVSTGLVLAMGSEGVVAWGAAAVVALGAVTTALTYRSFPRRAVRLAFPFAAASVATLGIAWVYAISTN